MLQFCHFPEPKTFDNSTLWEDRGTLFLETPPHLTIFPQPLFRVSACGLPLSLRLDNMGSGRVVASAKTS